MSRFLSLILTVALLHPLQPCAATLEGKVVGVTDGDTLTLLDSTNTQYKIRLSGIDAPERKQPFGQVSKQSLSDMVYNRTVLVDWDKRDRYGRVVGKVLVDTKDANLEQIKRGLAWHYTKYQAEQSASDRADYSQAQMNAKRQALGLWKDATSVPPWDWRKTKKKLP